MFWEQGFFRLSTCCCSAADSLVVPSALLFARVFEIVFPSGILCFFVFHPIERSVSSGSASVGDVSVRVNLHSPWMPR